MAVLLQGDLDMNIGLKPMNYLSLAYNAAVEYKKTQNLLSGTANFRIWEIRYRHNCHFDLKLPGRRSLWAAEHMLI